MRSSIPVLLLVLAFVLPACRTGPNYVARDPAYAHPSVPDRSDAEELALLGSANVAEQLAKSDLVFRGEVMEVGRSPGVGSGVAMVFQRVAYRVLKVLKGTAPSDQIVVRHVIAGGASADPAAANRLNPAIFREGARLIVWAERRPAPGYPGQSLWVCPFESPGPIHAATHAATRVIQMLP